MVTTMIRMVIIMPCWCTVLVHRLRMGRDVAPVPIIVNGVVTPISMAPLPVIETVQPDRVHDDPIIVGAQIIILAAHDADVFGAIIVVIVRDDDCWCRRRDHNRCRWRRRRYHD